MRVTRFAQARRDLTNVTADYGGRFEAVANDEFPHGKIVTRKKLSGSGFPVSGFKAKT